jgi:hypothetical protein
MYSSIHFHQSQTAIVAAAVPTPGLPDFPPVYFNGARQESDWTGGMIFDEKTGDSYPATTFTGDITIPNIGTFSSNGLQAILLYKITRKGDVAWATKLQPSGSGAYGSPVFSYVGGQGALDGEGNVWIYGDFYGILTIDGLAPLVGVASPSDIRTGFVAKFDAETGRAISAFTTYCTNPTSDASASMLWDVLSLPCIVLNLDLRAWPNRPFSCPHTLIHVCTCHRWPEDVQFGPYRHGRDVPFRCLGRRLHPEHPGYRAHH